MYHSYVMGIDDSIYRLDNQRFEINRDGFHKERVLSYTAKVR